VVPDLAGLLLWRATRVAACRFEPRLRRGPWVPGVMPHA